MTLFPHVSSTEKVILHPDLENVPLLILANKQDRMVGKFTLSVIWLQLTSQECLPLFYSDTDSSSLVAYSLGPRPKINPSADHFQYHTLYWKRFTHRMRSGDETKLHSIWQSWQKPGNINRLYGAWWLPYSLLTPKLMTFRKSTLLKITFYGIQLCFSFAIAL